ncbi:PD40 domain-containing protein [bacterium]|nr:PD40 domain-containing protein [bacterium]
MKHLFCIYVITAMLFVGCDVEKKTIVDTEKIIPEPTENSIVFMRDKDMHLYITDDACEKSYEITSFFDEQGNWGPDKKYIYFMSRFKLYKKKYNANYRIQLSPDSLMCELPRVSPNGKNIIFSGYPVEQEHQNCSIYHIDQNNNVRKLIHSGLISPSEEFHFNWGSWLPDGRRILFTYCNLWTDLSELESHIGLFDLKTRQIATISKLDSFYAGWAVASPTADEFVFTSYDYKLYIANYDGLILKQLTDEFPSWIPNWHPNGEKLIYCYYDKEQRRKMMIINRDGTDRHPFIVDGEEVIGVGGAW